MNLIDQLMDQLEVSRQQAEGGVGLLLGLAQQRLDSGDFQRVADSIPAISDLIGKAPRTVEAETKRATVLWRRLFGGWGRLSCLRPGCERLGIDRETVLKFIAVIGGYFREQAGEEVELLLLGCWR